MYEFKAYLEDGSAPRKWIVFWPSSVLRGFWVAVRDLESRGARNDSILRAS